MNGLLRRSVRFAPIAMALAGCGIPLTSPYEENDNICAAQTDCTESHTACVATVLGTGMCAATHADLGPVLLEVRTTNDGSNSFAFEHVLELNGDDPSGVSSFLELDLPPRVDVVGTYVVPDLISEACRAQDNSVPVAVTFHPLDRDGKPSSFASTITGTSTVVGTISTSESIPFHASVPAGLYDVYLAPMASDACPAPPPPRLLKGVTIDQADASGLVLGSKDDVFKYVSGVVRLAPDTPPEGWSLDVVDPVYGHVVSRPFAFTSAVDGEVSLSTEAAPEGVAYTAVDGPILRVHGSDPNLVIHWELVSFADADGVINANLADLDSTPVPVQGRLSAADGGVVPYAQVIIRSDKLTGTAQQIAQYRVSTETDATGAFSVNLVPGVYGIWFVPSSGEQASHFDEWQVFPNSGGSGKGFVLPAQPQLSGTVQDSAGAPISGVPVVVRPPRYPDATYSDLKNFRPRSQSSSVTSIVVDRQFSTNTELDGFFQLGVDHSANGIVDVAVQNGAASGFPWLVIPSVLIQDAKTVPNFDLGTLGVPYPAVVHGRLHDASGTAVGFAIIRAWVRPSAEDEHLLQVGEAQTDAAGNFVMPLPPSITGSLGTP
ncbi:MAG: hypothetical protein U0271_04580 [Polyangiaceae bacterium]